MLNRTTRYLRGLAAGIIGVALLVLVLMAAGCGKSTEKEDIIVRMPQKNTTLRPVSHVPAPPVDTVTTTQDDVEVAVEPEPELGKQVTYEEAEAAFNERRYEEAAVLFARYTESKTENPWGYYMLGLSTRMTRDYDVAEQAFRRALELDPGHVKSRLNLSRVLLDTDRADIALVEIDEALAVDVDSGDGYRLRGRALRQLGRKNDAVLAYQHAIVLDESDAWSMNNMALMFIEEGRCEEALPALARAVELDPHPVFLNNLGMALEGTGRFRAAEDAYRSALAADAFYMNAVSNLARIELVVEQPGVEPVDLGVLASNFGDEIRSWEQATAPGDIDDTSTEKDIASVNASSQDEVVDETDTATE